MFKILSLNCNYFHSKHGHWDKRKELIKAAIALNRPDLIALQAVCHEQGKYSRNQAQQIAESCGYCHWLFWVAEQDERLRKGQAMIFDSAPSLAFGRKLSMQKGLSDNTHRLILVSVVQTDQGILNVFNVHFSWIKEQAGDNLKETLEFIKSYKGLALLVGDFNQPPECTLFEGFKKQGWSDIWAELNKTDPGFTFESDNPSMRIDYVWANEKLKSFVKGVEVLDLRSRDNKARLSDHLGLFVTLSLNNKERRVNG